jgi:hypothetical protein
MIDNVNKFVHELITDWNFHDFIKMMRHYSKAVHE